jgi:hypothetical protein
MPDKGMGRVSDIALLTHIKAIHDENGGACGWLRIWRELWEALHGGKVNRLKCGIGP